MIVVALPALVCLIGLLMYALCVNPKLAAIGFELFRIGLLCTLLLAGWGHVVRIP